jgi:hypothetical protein
MFCPEDPVCLFAEYLESCTLGNVDGDEKTERLTDLVVELSDLKVDSNGGDPEGHAIEGHALHPINMMMPQDF